MTEKSFKEFITESSLNRVRQHQLEHDTGIITAFRYAPDCGNGKPYTKSDNKKRNKVLKASLYSLGYGITNVDGTYVENFSSKDDIAKHAEKLKKDPKTKPLPNAIDVDEDSFFVVDLNDSGNLKSDLKKLGQQWEQDSILFIPKGGKSGQIIGTNKCPSEFISLGKVINLGNPVFGASGEFKSKVNGRSFVLKEDNNLDYKRTIPRGATGKHLNSILANSDWKTLED